MCEKHGLVPIAVMSRSTAGRIAYFKNHAFVAHTVIAETKDQLLAILRYPGATNIVMVYGPTGTGKTTVRQKLSRIFDLNVKKNPEKFLGRILFPGINLDCDENAQMSFRDSLYVPALKALCEPLIEKKVEYGIRGIRYDEAGQIVIQREVRKADLREVVIKTLQHRKPFAFWIDDAQHLVRAGSGSKQDSLMDSIKMLTELSGITFVLFGTYDMLSMVGLKPEISRRTTLLHLRRYHLNEKTDRIAFQRTLYTLQYSLPIEQQPDLIPYTDYFFEQSLGCIGTLKDRLTDALAVALSEKAKTIRPGHWMRREKPEWELERMDWQIRDGEAYLQDTMSLPEQSMSTHHSQEDSRSNGRQRPGEQKAKRHEVGPQINVTD